MSRYPMTEVFEQLLGHPVAERGNNAMVRCPFHMDDRPSMSIDLERGLWVCFGCGEKGSIFSLARRLEQEVDDTDIMLRAYDAASSSPYYEPLDFTDKAVDLHRAAWADQPKAIVEYILGRGYHPGIFRHFRLGWTGSAIAMPYYDDDRCRGIKYRGLDGSKWSEKGSTRFLYNVNDVRGAANVILCEGESDTHAVWSVLRESGNEDWAVAGVPGVSVSRSTWELWSLELVWSKKVALLFDADEAGDREVVTPLSILGDKASRVRPTRGKDITLHLREGGTLGELMAL